jgi:hypothetical protein
MHRLPTPTPWAGSQCRRAQAPTLRLVTRSLIAGQAKLEAIPPPRLASWRASNLIGTPREAVAYYQALTDAGMQYFVAFVYGADLETPRLLAERVIPELRAA